MRTPSKKIILLAVAILLLATAFFAFTKLSQKTSYTAETISVDPDTKLAIDTDSDGLKDWEERLWKTDASNPDTDGDSTPDGQEIKLGRNPLVAGPNDKLDTDTINSKINSQTEEDLTETDKFSRELFVKIIAANQSETPATEADFQNFLNTTIQKEIESQKTTLHTAGDFRVDLKETPEKIKVYGNSIATILTKKPSQKLEFELAIVNKAETNKDPNELKKLEPLIAEYKRIEADLLKVTVPQSALSVHIALVNATVSMEWSLTGLKYIFSDPIKSLPGLSAYPDNSQNFQTAIRQFKNYFQSADITFVASDSGYQFFDTI